jgi:tetratricopeptide (TPR) repeat protein
MRNKLLASAQKHMDKGNLTRAIKDFHKLLEIQPGDVRVRLRIGDLQARLGKKREAVETYEQVAEDYFYQGFYLKSVAVLKQILRLDPARTDIQVRLAELYQQLNLLSDSMAQYRAVAAVFKDRGDFDKYIEVLFRIAELDPEDINVYIIIAEQLSALDRREEAADAFAVAADRLRAAGRVNEFIKVAERYVFHRSDDLHRLKELVAAYLNRQDPKRALAKLQLLFKVAPKDSEGLELLVEAFLAIDKPAKATRVLKELAELYTGQGQEELAIEAYRRVLDIDPGDLDAQAFLGMTGHHDAIELEPASAELPVVPGPGEAALGVFQGPTAYSHPVAEPQRAAAPNLRLGAAPDLGGLSGRADQASTQHQLLASQTMVHPSITGAIPIDIEPLEEEDSIISTWRRLEASTGIFQMPSGVVTCNKALSVGDADSIARLLVEIDGFVKYGLYDQARQTLDNVLELDPLSVSARERAMRLAQDRGNGEDAVEQLLALTKICWRPDQERALAYLDQAEDLAPGHEEIAALRVELGVPDHRQAPGYGPPGDEAPVGIVELSDDDDDDDLFVPFDVAEDDDDLEELVAPAAQRPAAFDSGPNTPLPSRAAVGVAEAEPVLEPVRGGASFERADTVAGDVRSLGMAWAGNAAGGRPAGDPGWAPPYAPVHDDDRAGAALGAGLPDDDEIEVADYLGDDDSESVIDDSEAAILAALAGPDERRELSSGSYRAALQATPGPANEVDDGSDLPLYEASYSADHGFAYDEDDDAEDEDEHETRGAQRADGGSGRETEGGVSTQVDLFLSRAVDVYANEALPGDDEDDEDDDLFDHGDDVDSLEDLAFEDEAVEAPEAAAESGRSPSLELDALTSLASGGRSRRFSLEADEGELSPADLGVSVWEEVAATAAVPLDEVESLGERAASSAASGELAPPPEIFAAASRRATAELDEFEELGIEDFEEIEELDDFDDMVVEEIAIEETGSLPNGNGHSPRAPSAHRRAVVALDDDAEPEGIQFDLPPLPPGLPSDLCDEINELEFYASLGLRDEMKSLLFDITSSFPEHAEWIMERVAVIEEQAGLALGL